MGSQTDDEGARRWQIAVTAGTFDAGLRFAGDFDLEMSEVLALLSVGYRVTDDLTVGLRAGAVLDGELRAGGRTWDVKPGGVVSLQGEYRLLAAPSDPVTLTAGIALASSFASTEEVGGGGETASLTAFDLRASLTVSRTLWSVLTPYFSARAFGGPALWSRDGVDVTGSDRGHYQLALGVSVAPAPWLALSFEWAFLGETALYGQVALAF
ncbi:MAG: hypothetical protein CVU56_19185 [Deltaproteobacteria bacterium HGW-Deltaproteobacteria-14]|nr:MAG: hypothetical protein CVU56_19185 [Deltaproteobacteria bacterium HGW-Deltaproteobacteria-14]